MTIGRCLAAIAARPGETIPSHIVARMSGQGAFQVRHSSANMMVWTDGNVAALPIDPDGGIVVGTVFEGLFPARSISRLEQRHVATIGETRGRSLHTDMWGGFVAFLRSCSDGEVRVVRDASLACPIYFAMLGPCVVTATRVRDLELLGAAKPAIDLAYLAGHLQIRGFRFHRTALVGIEELCPGEHLVIANGGARCEQGWSPWSFAARSAQITDRYEAAEMLAAAVDSATSAWVSRYHHVLLGVSGGLDSSIVAASLDQTETGLTLLNLLSVEGSLGDERHYASALGRGLGRKISHATESIANIDLRRSDAAHLPRPISRAFSQSGSCNVGELAEAVGADVVFSGGGGDNVFCFIQSSAPVADRILSHAGPFEFGESVRDVSALSGAGAFTVARSAVRRLQRRHPAYMWKPDFSFLHDSYRAAAFDVSCHPWLVPSKERLPGKLEHIGLLVTVSNFTEGFGYERKFPVIYPLLSQPVVELCLRIPSWMWCRGGVNRAVARDAFRSRLPLEIIERTTKGSFDRLAIELIEQQGHEIEDLLCGGFLAHAGVLRTEEIHGALREPTGYDDLTWARILAFVDVEAWCRSWQ